MRGAVARGSAAALAVVLLAPIVVDAQDFSITDARLVEGSSGFTDWQLTIYRGGPGAASNVPWTAVPGSATASDFVTANPYGSGVLSFGPADTSLQITVRIIADTTPEWSSTLQQDEVFFVDLGMPTVGGIQKGRGTVTIVDDDVSQPGVQFLSAVTDSTGPAAGDGRNRLQWRVPAGQTLPSQIVIAWTSGPTSCVPPTSDTAGEAPGPVNLAPLAAGSRQTWTHDFSNGPVQVPRVYCYTVFVRYPALSGERAHVVTKTFDSTTGSRKWTYTAGYYGGSAAGNVVPPTVGADGIYSVGTDGVVHAMQRGDAGGTWPPLWNPLALGKPAHNRSPVVSVQAGISRLFVGTESGEVHAVDARQGTLAWSRSQLFGTTQLMPSFSTGVQAIPAGLFKAYGGQNDLLLVGTATAAGSTKFFALNPANGATIDDYPNGGDTPPGPLGNVFGMAVVDYANNRVYFGTASGGASHTLWSLDLGPMGAPNLSLTSTATLPWNPKPLGISSGTQGSPVLRGTQLYLGTDSGAAGAVHSLCLTDGSVQSYTHGDGQLKGFAWPDRRDTRLYFSTTSKVHAIRDDGSSLNPYWATPISVTSPSIALQKPGTDFLYVGDGTGRLLQINILTQVITPMQLDTGSVQIGAPSLDNVHNLLLVGSDKGVIYAIRVPF